MNANTAVRSQTDEKQGDYDFNSALDCSADNNKDMTRQEDALKTDINHQLKQFGLDPFAPRLPQFGTVDYRLDKISSLNAMNDAKSAFKQLPLALRQQYGNWAELLAAADRGELDGINLKTGERSEDLTPVEPEPIIAAPSTK